jgi:hypothetical protein
VRGRGVNTHAARKASVPLGGGQTFKVGSAF